MDLSTTDVCVKEWICLKEREWAREEDRDKEKVCLCERDTHRESVLCETKFVWVCVYEREKLLLRNIWWCMLRYDNVLCYCDWLFECFRLFFFLNRTTVCKDKKMKCVQETVNRYVLFLWSWKWGEGQTKYTTLHIFLCLCECLTK